MSARERPTGSSPHLEELLAGRALGDLDALEHAELEGALQPRDRWLADELALAAAALDLTWSGAASEPLPAGLRERLVADGETWLAARAIPTRGSPAARVPAPVVPEPPRSLILPMLGWALAAAATVVALLGWMTRPDIGHTPDPDRAYAALRAAPGTANPAWEATPLAAGASGDVAWSQDEQRGFLHIVGLEPNDPRVEQYQLWILDEEQKHPIDGGVFDVRGAEVVVPIQAKLRVERPTAFAVTLERPGGVVVSDQERVVLLAKL